jgi:agmatine deiminase
MRGDYYMPAEWAEHEATWLGWPHHPTDWPGKLQAVEWAYAEMIRKLSVGEHVNLAVENFAMKRRVLRILGAAGISVSRVRLHYIPTNRGWMRDSGPIFVRHAERRSRAIVHFHFNGWARYRDWQKDRRVPEYAARLLRVPLIEAVWKGRRVVLEGGSIDVNGRGCLITTEECLMDGRRQVRNPGFSRADVEAVFERYLGIRHVIWLGKGIVGDDTHGHVDDICRFVNPNTVVLCRERNSRDENYRVLEENRERLASARLENGARLEVVELPMPAPLYFRGSRLPASYANFYIANAAVLVPTFNDPMDRVALGILGELFRDRAVVGIHASDLVVGLGTIHCLTQQQPAL